MTHEEEMQYIKDLRNKFSLLGIQVKMIEPRMYSFESTYEDAKIMIAEQDNLKYVYLPHGLEIAEKHNDNIGIKLILILNMSYLSRNDIIKISGKCPKNATNLCRSIKANTLDLIELDMSEVEILDKAFNSVEVENLLLPNIEKVTSSNELFAYSKIINANKFKINTRIVRNFARMFEKAQISKCLAQLDIDTSNAYDYTYMYAHASILTDLDISYFKQPEYASKGMFVGTNIMSGCKIILDSELWMNCKKSSHNKNITAKNENSLAVLRPSSDVKEKA